MTSIGAWLVGERKGRGDPPFFVGVITPPHGGLAGTRTRAGLGVFIVLMAIALAPIAVAQSPGPGSGGIDEACRETLDSVVGFASDRTTLDGKARALVRQQAKCLERYPALRVTIEGYWDDSATRSQAKGLSERLAHAVRAELVRSGIDGARLTIVGYGRDRVLDPGRPYERRRAARVVIAP